MSNVRTPLITAIALLTAAASVAQPQDLLADAATPQRDETATDVTERDQATSGTSSAARTMGTAAATGATASLGTQDATFLRKAMEGDKKEIASAQAALQHAQSSATKDAARMILDDHRKSSEKLQALASRKGWQLPAEKPMADADAAHMKPGPGFDERFTAEQVRMHREAISLYRAQVAGGKDPDLQQFAKETLPHLEHHLEMLQGKGAKE